MSLIVRKLWSGEQRRGSQLPDREFLSTSSDPVLTGWQRFHLFHRGRYAERHMPAYLLVDDPGVGLPIGRPATPTTVPAARAAASPTVSTTYRRRGAGNRQRPGRIPDCRPPPPTGAPRRTVRASTRFRRDRGAATRRRWPGWGCAAR